MTSAQELLSAIVDNGKRTKRPRFRVDFVTRFFNLAARPSLEPRPLQVFILSFLFCLTDRPSVTQHDLETRIAIIVNS